MKFFAFTYLLFLPFISYTQKPKVKLFDGSNQKVYLNFLHDSLAYLSIEDYESNSFEYIIGKYSVKKDSFLFSAITMEEDIVVDLKKDVYYKTIDSIKPKEFSIEFRYSDNLVSSSNLFFDSIIYVINDVKYPCVLKDEKGQIIIERPTKKQVKLDVFVSDHYYFSSKFNMIDDFNSVQIKISGYTTLLFFYFDFGKSIPEVIFFDGKEYFFHYELN